MLIKTFFFVFFLAFSFVFANSINAQQSTLLDPSINSVFENFTGSVTALAKQPDGKILVGGYFLLANNKDRFGLARFNADGTLDESFNPPLGVFPTGVRAIVVQTDGKILVGGLFQTPSSQDFKNIARLNSNGSEDTTFTGFTNSTVNAIAIQSDGKILIGGAFTTVNNTSRFGTARLNTNGSLDTAFTFTIRTVFSIAIQPDGNILLGGNFATTSPNVINRIVRVSSTGAVDTAFIANASADNTVRSIKLQSDGKIVTGGSFAFVNSTFHNNLARLNANGTLDSSFNPSITGLTTTSIESLDVDTSGRILIGGNFTGINGNPRSNVGRINSDGTLDTTFTHQTGANLPVRSVIAENDGSSFIGGDFQVFDSTAKYRFAKLNSNGSINSLFNAAVYSNGSINEIEIQPDGKIIAAGSFFYVNGTTGYGSITRFNTNGTIDSSFANFTQSQFFADPIEDVEIQPDGKIIIAGAINIASNPTTYGVIRLNANGTVDNTFTPVTFTSNIPRVVKYLPSGQILVGGEFTALNGITRNGFARLNSNGSLDSTFNPTIVSSPSIFDIAVRNDGKILIGGNFAMVNGIARNNLAQLNSDGTTDTGFSANASNTVLSFKELQDSTLLVSGNFTMMNGTLSNKVAKLLTNGQLDSSFTVDLNLAMPSYVIKTYPDGRIIVAGQATSLNFLPNNVVILNSNGSTNAVLQNSQWFNGGVSDVEVQSDGKVIFGGYFTQVGATNRFALARLNSLNFSRKNIFDFDGDGKTDISIFRPTVGEWWINRSSSGQTVAAQFGNNSDKLVPSDFTGDGKTDIAIWRPSTGEWFVLRSEDGSFFSFPFGTSGDIPVVGDFDGDGKADPGVFRPSNSTWFISKSSGGTIIQQFGTTGDVPVVADYDGDGKSDIAIYRPSNGQWWLSRSGSGVVATSFGNSTDKPVQGDYTGDGKADIAFFRPSTGEWFILRSEDSSFFSFPFGTNGDVPAPGDYDGDGKFDAGVFRPSSSTWFVNRTTAGILITSFGTTGDQPLPNVFVP